MEGDVHLSVARRAAAELGLDVDARAWCKIDKILKLLNKYRSSLNLTGADSLDELTLHAAEALVAVAAACRAGAGGGTWLDVGSGAGFPGLIVGCVWDAPVTLVEPRARRAAFLELAVASAGIDAVVRRIRLEEGRARVLDGGGGLDRGFGVASARAVFNPEDWRHECQYWVRDGGVCLVHARHQAPGAHEEPAAVAVWGGWEVRAYVSRGT